MHMKNLQQVWRICPTFHAYLNLPAHVLSVDVVLDDKLQRVPAPQSLLQLGQLGPVPDDGARTPLLGPAVDPHVGAPPLLLLPLPSRGPRRLTILLGGGVGHRDLVPPERRHVQVGEVPVLQNVNLLG